MMSNELALISTNKKNYIKALLTAKGIRVKDIAAELGIAPPTVSQVISGVKTSRRIRELIAKKVDKTPEELWPRKTLPEAE